MWEAGGYKIAREPLAYFIVKHRVHLSLTLSIWLSLSSFSLSSFISDAIVTLSATLVTSRAPSVPSKRDSWVKVSRQQWERERGKRWGCESAFASLISVEKGEKKGERGKFKWRIESGSKWMERRGVGGEKKSLGEKESGSVCGKNSWERSRWAS